MRKFRVIAPIIFLPLIILFLGGMICVDHDETRPFQTHDSDHREQNFILQQAAPANIIAKSEQSNTGVNPLHDNTKDNQPGGWWAHFETIESLSHSTTTHYIRIAVGIHRFKNTDIIFPFHFFW